MLYHNRQELLAILKRENLFTEKKFGQNFLFNTQIIEKILQAADLTKADQVLEVGPGLGILTNELIQSAGQVITIELDNKLIPYLQRTFSSAKNLESSLFKNEPSPVSKRQPIITSRLNKPTSP